MSWLEDLKSERKMTFNHWRYRVLHWCFKCNPITPADSPLPEFMYTHYCPLFHVTNIIVMFAPIILLFRTARLLLIGIFRVVDFLFSKMLAPVFNALCNAVEYVVIGLWKAVRPKPKAPKPPREPTNRQKRRRDFYMIRHLVFSGDQYHEFDYLLSRYTLGIITPCEAETYHNYLVTNLLIKRKRKEQRLARLRARLAALAIISQIVVKFMLNILYVCLGIGLIVGLYYAVPWCFSVCWSFAQGVGKVATFSWAGISELFSTYVMLEAIAMIAGILALAFVAIVVTTLIILTLMKLEAGKKFARGAGIVGSIIAPPFLFAGWLFALPFKWAVAFVKGTMLFISIFYEENCPPIQIMKDEG